MVTIIFYACLVASTGRQTILADCHQVQMVREGLTVAQCSGAPGQFAIAEWLSALEHTKRVWDASRGFKCVDGKSDES